MKLILLLLALLVSWTGLAEAETAREIIDATGIMGGVIVHVGCRDGKLTAALHVNESYLVQGLDTDEKNVRKGREYLRSCRLYGKVSVDKLSNSRLPYIDNFVNLVVSEDLGRVSMDEVMRVLSPGGVAYIKKAGKWVKTTKPRPGEIDEWTHYLHDADNNAVAHDSVIGPLRSLQWVGSPHWARHHDNLASMSALVSSGGRIFYIFDEGPTASILLPPQWRLIARDAFNGTVLWKRTIKKWFTHRWPNKSGPALLPRRLVAAGDTVFVTLGIKAPLSALDAATGRSIRTYSGTEGTEEVLYSDGTLFLVVNKDSKRWDYPDFGVWNNVNKPWWAGEQKQIMSLRSDATEIVWEKTYPVVPLTIAADRRWVVFHDGERIVCLDRTIGKQQWKSDPIPRVKKINSFFAPTLVLADDVVLFAGGEHSGLVKSGGGATGIDSMSALSAKDGRILWTAPHPPSGYSSPEDLFVINKLVWTGNVSSWSSKGTFTGRDLHTGEVKNEFDTDAKTHWFHHRCYRGKATDRYFMVSRTGIEFIDQVKKHWTIHHWTRGGCTYGIMPCNGLIYTPPHPCACYLQSKTNGFCALSPARPGDSAIKDIPDADRFERGPAYGKVVKQPLQVEKSGDWPTYRHDAARSGFTAVSVPADLKRAWQTKLGGRLCSIVIAGGKLFIASIDTHTVHALEASSGKPLWSYTVGGRVDSPPTIYRGMVLFGSADGWVYSLRVSDGELVWRFRAAPVDRRLMAFEQIESVWPVSGSVLVQDGILYCVAGRSMFLDGGLRLLRLDPETGRKIGEKILDEMDPVSNKNLQVRIKNLDMPVALPDILSSDGKYVYMRSQRFDKKGSRMEFSPLTGNPVKEASRQAGEGRHLFCPTGFLDSASFHRSYWVFGKSFASGWNAYYLAGKYTPSGKILVFDDSRVYGFGRKPKYYRWTSATEYQLFAADKTAPAVGEKTPGQKNKASGKGLPFLVKHHWTQDIPMLVRAMVLADGNLYISGPPNVVNEAKVWLRKPEDQAKLQKQAAALNGDLGALLRVVSTKDGSKLAEYKLDSPPVFDGMAAANGRIYIAAMDGKVVCYGEK